MKNTYLFSIGFAFVLPLFVIALSFSQRSATRLENHPARFDDRTAFGRAARASSAPSAKKFSAARNDQL
jgi:hypothetical protein